MFFFFSISVLLFLSSFFLRVITSQFVRLLPKDFLFLTPTVRKIVDKSPACFKSLSNQHKIIPKNFFLLPASWLVENKKKISNGQIWEIFYLGDQETFHYFIKFNNILISSLFLSFAWERKEANQWGLGKKENCFLKGMNLW